MNNLSFPKSLNILASVFIFNGNNYEELSGFMFRFIDYKIEKNPHSQEVTILDKLTSDKHLLKKGCAICAFEDDKPSIRYSNRYPKSYRLAFISEQEVASLNFSIAFGEIRKSYDRNVYRFYFLAAKVDDFWEFNSLGVSNRNCIEPEQTFYSFKTIKEAESNGFIMHGFGVSIEKFKAFHF